MIPIPGSTAPSSISHLVQDQQGLLDAIRLTPDDIRLTVGEKVQATVTGQLPNGRFTVLVKDQLLDLNLPRNTQPGEQLELSVLSKDPQLTFRLNLSPNLPTALPPNEPNVALSKGATLIGEVLRQADGTPSKGVEQNQPLFSGKPDTAQLAGQLAGRLTESGVFYEAHQAEWVTGQRPLQALLQEPQANFQANLANAKDGTRNLADKAATNAAAANDSSPTNIGDKNSIAEKSIQRFGNELTLNSAQLKEAVVDEKGLQQVVRQQLDLLENKPLVWQGPAWPGQPLRWELALENEGQHQASDEQEQQQWQTRLALDLPNLGALGVVAQLQQGQFKLRFQASSEATLQLLRDQQPELMRRFEAAGLTLVATQVDRDEK
jgi:hypothetical protein